MDTDLMVLVEEEQNVGIVVDAARLSGCRLLESRRLMDEDLSYIFMVLLARGSGGEKGLRRFRVYIDSLAHGGMRASVMDVSGCCS